MKDTVADILVSALVYAFWCIIFLGTAFTVYEWLFVDHATIPVTSANPSPECVLLDTVDYGKPIVSEDSPGEYRYEVYATPDGVAIYQCT